MNQKKQENNALQLLINDYIHICGYSETEAHEAALVVMNEKQGQTSLCL